VIFFMVSQWVLGSILSIYQSRRRGHPPLFFAVSRTEIGSSL